MLKRRHERRYVQVKAAKRDEAVKSHFDSQSSGLKGRPSDMFSQERGSTFSAAETTTIIARDTTGMLERVPSFAIESANFL